MIESREEIMKRKIIMAEIEDNAWKRRGEKSNHEEYIGRMEKEKKKEKRGKVRDTVNFLPERVIV